MRSALIAVATLLSAASLAWSQEHSQPYAGLESRDIKSLSEQDISDILAGRGWGFALPAELNGLPGPTHVLELADRLSLTEKQLTAVQAVFDEMRQEAITIGRQFVEAEAAVSSAFEAGAPDQEALKSLLAQASDLRSELRYIHLSRHIETADILTSQQIERYAVLRGYADDPCDVVPDGHNAQIWRLHNGCS